MKEATILLIKPDGIRRKLIGPIFGMLPHNLSIIGIKGIPNVSQGTAEEHYSEHREKDFFPWLIIQITSGPIVAIALYGPDAMSTIRGLAGDIDPAKAAKIDPESIRGLFGEDSLEISRDEQRAVQNLVHTADGSLSAERELKIWFPESDFFPH